MTYLYYNWLAANKYLIEGKKIIYKDIWELNYELLQTL